VQLMHEQASSGTPPEVNDDPVEAKERQFAVAVNKLLAYAGGVDPLKVFKSKFVQMAPGSGEYAEEQVKSIPDNLKTPDWELCKGWLESRSGFSSFMGEHSRVGEKDTVPIVRAAVQNRLTALGADSKDSEKVVKRSKQSIQENEWKYMPLATKLKEYTFTGMLKGQAEAAARTAYDDDENPDIKFVTNELDPKDQLLIDQYDAAVLPIVLAKEIHGNPIGLRNQFDGMLRSSNGLKYVFASGFRVQMQRIINAAVRPTRLHGVEVSIANRRADYTEWSEGDLITVVEVKNWTGQDKWTPENRASYIAGLEAQVRDHLKAGRTAPPAGWHANRWRPC
jgi:hypothetical protein